LPPIRSVTLVDDGLTIETHRGTFTLTRANFLPSLLSQGPQAVQDRINNVLIPNAVLPGGESLFGCNVEVHVYQTDPVLKWAVYACDGPIPPDWDYKL